MRKALFLAASIVSISLATAAFAQNNSGSAGGAPGSAPPSAAAPSASAGASGQGTSQHHRARARHRGRAGGGMRNAQQALKSQGLYQGNIDGKYGPQTKAAISQFQQQHNLKQTGRLDRATRVALRGGASQNRGAAMNGGSGSPPNATSANPNNNADARTAPSGSSMVPPGAGAVPKPNPGATQPAQ